MLKSADETTFTPHLSPHWLLTWVIALFLVIHAGALPTRSLPSHRAPGALRTRLSRRVQQGIFWVCPVPGAC